MEIRIKIPAEAECDADIIKDWLKQAMQRAIDAKQAEYKGVDGWLVRAGLTDLAICSRMAESVTLVPGNHILQGVLDAMREMLNMVDAWLDNYPPDSLIKAHKQRAEMAAAIHVLEAYIKARL